MSSVSSLAHRPAATAAVSPESARSPPPGWPPSAPRSRRSRATSTPRRSACLPGRSSRPPVRRSRSGSSGAPPPPGTTTRCRPRGRCTPGSSALPLDWVAVGSQTSVFAGLVAASLPDDAEVVCVSGDFSSMVFPFLAHADRGVTVRQVPLEDLAASVTPRTTLVAFSLAQSACGSLVDAADVVRAAREVGALTFCDLTQAAGWLPGRRHRLRPHGLLGLQVALPAPRHRLPDGAARAGPDDPADPRRLVRRRGRVGVLLRTADAPGRRRRPVRRLPGVAVLGRRRCRRCR